ncbi:hypothetical protein UFOVP779_38 [uncultured Caudovirales phage]|uniref:Uncharacterized protein n=1 Tax=uncultured Caudovirales phage TaxID=2100421 RepID=A0A6J5NXM9_9CAUD|nr:hypothetical protein UFOVP779_38 [uncultured Caudovirales phage]
MITQGVGYTFTNSSDGFSLQIDQPGRLKEVLPFSVYEDTNSAGQGVLRLTPGTFNNEFPTINGVRIGEPGATLALPQVTSLVVLNITASENFFPAAIPTITIKSGLTVDAFSETSAQVALALIKVTTITGSTSKTLEISSLVSGSLWGERFQCGEELEYWFSKI